MKKGLGSDPPISGSEALSDAAPREPRPPSGALSSLVAGDAALEACLLDYIRSFSRYYSRSESKLLQRCREQMYQELEMGPLLQRLERACGPLEGTRVLEIGCGSGGRSVALAMRGADVTGIEPSEKGVEASRLRAQRYPGIKTQFHVGLAERLPFPDGTFDLVFSAEVLQHVRSLQLAIAESNRVLRPAGHCYHEGPNALYPYEFHYRIAWLPGTPARLGKLYARARGKDPRHLDDIRFLYRHSLISLLRQNGFSGFQDLYVDELADKVRTRSTIRHPFKRRICALLHLLGLARPTVGAVSAIGVYPQFRLHAVKGAEPAARTPGAGDSL